MADIVLTCCGRGYTLAEFRALGTAIYQSSGITGIDLEMRRCPGCGSHRAIYVRHEFVSAAEIAAIDENQNTEEQR